MNKILLVHPEISHKKQTFDGILENEPLELEYIAAMLKENKIEYEIFDVSREEMSFEEKFREYNPEYLYMCGRLKQENFMKKYLEMAKKINPAVINLVGGLLVQCNWERFYNEYTDYIFRSFDIFGILPIVLNTDKNISKIDGLCYKENGIWKENNIKPFDINRLPFPDREYLHKHLDRYRYMEMVPCAQIRTAYSCPFNCKFCYRSQMNMGKYTARDVELVIEEIKQIELENIYIIDDDFLIDEKRIKQFVELIKENNIKKNFVCYGRADFIVSNKELIKELKKIGFKYIITGIETITDERLNNYDKKTNMDINIECIEFMHSIDLNLMAMFIVDLDYAGKDFSNMYKWIKKNNQKYYATSIYTPIPGTKLFEEYKNKIITDNPENYDYFHLVVKPNKISIKAYYFHYYILLIKLFILSYKNKVFDFIDYKSYIIYGITSALSFRGYKDK